MFNDHILDIILQLLYEKPAQNKKFNMQDADDTPYRPDIDGLRAFAVISVILYHGFPTVFAGGFVGVDVFFVISGFLISANIFRKIEVGNFSFGDFYGKRIRRIFPSLLVILFACFTYGFVVLLPSERALLGLSIAGGGGSFPIYCSGTRLAILIKPRLPNHCCIYGRSASRNSSTSFGRSLYGCFIGGVRPA